MRNRYPGTCYRCGLWCPEGEGHFERRGHEWLLQHARCAIMFRGTDRHYRRAPNVPPAQDEQGRELKRPESIARALARIGLAP